MRLEHLMYFSEIARCKSLNKAAQNLFITQPALTSALDTLEKELGFKLLIRSYQGVALTPNGERLLSDCEQIFAITSQWKVLAEEEQSHEPIHIVANPAAYSSMITPLILELSSCHKGLNVFTYEVKNQAVLSYLEENEYSICIFSVLPKDEAQFQQKIKEKHCKLELLLEDQCRMMISPAHPLAMREHIMLADCSSLNLAMYPERDDPISAPLFKKYFTDGSHFHLSNLQNILQVVADNKAVAIMPYKIISKNPYVLNGQIALLEIIDYPQPLNYYIAYRKDNLKSDTYKHVIRLTKQVFQREILGE